jgi:adenylate kinase family enzyme
MRIVVVGTTGAGKTTLARRIAALLELPHIELDAINWQSGWRDLTRHDPEEFVRRVAEAIEAHAWVVDGSYGPVRDRVWQRATHLVWLDYERPVIMARVICRSLLRAVLRTELWAGNRERWRHLLRPSHPIRWAWSTWDRRRRETAERLAQREYAHLVALRLHRPTEVQRAVDLLAGTFSSLRDGPEGHVWMAPGSQGLFRVCGSNVICGHVSGLLARPPAAGPDGFRGSRPDQAREVALPHGP